MARKRKIKYIEPKMKFNPGTLGFEPDLSLKDKSPEEKKSWFWIILLLIILILLIIFFIYY